MEDDIHTDELRKQVGVAILISDKIDFKNKTKQKRWGRILHTHQRKSQEDIAIVNIYRPNTVVPMFIKETLLQFLPHTNPYTRW